MGGASGGSGAHDSAAYSARDTAVAEFERHRRYLGAVAYRLLGSIADAEDAVQDAWLRWQGVDHADIADARAYLTTVVTRICYDVLGSARVRREAYYGEWLPEPLVRVGSAAAGALTSAAVEASPEDEAVLGEDVSYALLTVMEQLTPAERAAFVLHDVFAVGFEEVAAALDRSPEAVRQLASRARRRVRGNPPAADGRDDADGRVPVAAGVRPAPRPGREQHRRTVAAFAAASRDGDIPALMKLLDPAVVWHSDGGGLTRAGVRPIETADNVARLVVGLVSRWLAPQMGYYAEEAEVNGAPGLVMRAADGSATGVVAVEFAGGRITSAYAIVNPEKLRHVPPAGGESPVLVLG